MTKIKSLSTAAIAVLISTSSWAASDSNSPDPSEMPMAHGNAGGMMTDGKSHNMPTMDMQMMHQMHQMHQMQAMGHDHDHAHGHGHGHGHGQNQGMSKMVMNPKMMQMRMQHMANMEQSLKNIESLLAELVAQAKAK
jgi:hypothetical protein